MELKLPTGVISQVDIVRLQRELNSLNDFFASAEVRQKGASSPQPPRLTRLLEEIAETNQLNLLEKKHRDDLLAKLEAVRSGSPVLHISFASEPAPKALATILVWLRNNIHPQVLLQVGLQPTIAAGCVLRSPNKIFDMSLREHLQKQEPYLVELIRGATRER